MNEDLAKIMEENLVKVWSQRDDVLRLQAIKKIYTTDSTLYHVGEKTEGVEAINASAGAVLSNLPPNFVFTKLKPVIINNNIGRLIWGIGSPGGALVVTGMDIAHFENGKIKALYVFLES